MPLSTSDHRLPASTWLTATSLNPSSFDKSAHVFPRPRIAAFIISRRPSGLLGSSSSLLNIDPSTSLFIGQCATKDWPSRELAGRSTLNDLDPAAREAFAERLRLVVAAIGTQAEAAEVAGVSLAQLKNYLSGTSAPGFIAVGRLAVRAHIRLEWILTGEGSKEAGDGPVHESLRYAERTRRAILVAMAIGDHLEALRGVELPDEIDDAIGRFAETLAKLVVDEAERTELTECVRDLVVAVDTHR